ncbi:hypothetical protein [Demequina subtropica]|uniref:hypothetical protein n=1 Tax=Demequina subtropica TaxID=1638989 RepID=UPI00078060AC|nr:hypothetical protein [Demequina subtropica]
MNHDGVRLDTLIRLLHQAYDAAFEEALADRSTTRVELVMLSVLARAAQPMTWDALESAMGPRYSAVACTEAWNALAVAGWAVEPDGLYAATDAGRDVVDDLDEERERIVARATEGLSEDEVATAIVALRGMLANLSA